ncbi:MAG: polyprenyl synthetase family protein [Thermoplasmata archaeon]|jgi:geranylgeranyl pyrophosphate synthase|nr:polyprenyl synthetase family protein [Thermoplasmata archaeon]
MTTSPWDFGIQKELGLVDEKLREMVKSQEQVLTDASLHVIEAGGKRLRPTVTILAYKALGGRDVGKIVDIAAGFELIHSATLIHDDINDGGSTRRGRMTVYKKFGLHDAIVTGDFLFAKAFQLGGTFDKTVVDTTSDACAALAEGEILQNRYRHKKDLTIDTYLQVAERKTAQPIKAGAMVGGYLAGGSSEEVASLGKYGLDLGIAFQIVDDILDFTGDEKKTGKMVGNDLKEGNLTLPSLLAIKSSDDAKKAILAVISQEDPSVESVKECAKMVVKSGAIEKARGMGEYYGMEALGHLGCLSDTSYSKALRDVVAKVLERDS